MDNYLPIKFIVIIIIIIDNKSKNYKKVLNLSKT